VPYTISTSQIVDNLAISKSPVSGTGSSNVVVLIIEDNEVNQSLLAHIFRNWNLPFEIANNGLEAIEKLKVKKYDLVLMDIQMPVMDGYTTARKIRNELKSDMPIIAMTAHAMPGEKEKCLSYGMNDYIAKPVKQEHLSRLISRFTSFVQPGSEEDARDAGTMSNDYKYINLGYLQEVGAGDKVYERETARKFLQAIPLAMEALEHSVKEGNEQQMRAIAHNLKTTISVMGLNELLDPLLDEVEFFNGDRQHLKHILEAIQDICYKAMAEAKQFHKSLS
jgi:CheY-like chemotaxis protein